MCYFFLLVTFCFLSVPSLGMQKLIGADLYAQQVVAHGQEMPIVDAALVCAFFDLPKNDDKSHRWEWRRERAIILGKRVPDEIQVEIFKFLMVDFVEISFDTCHRIPMLLRGITCKDVMKVVDDNWSVSNSVKKQVGGRRLTIVKRKSVYDEKKKAEVILYSNKKKSFRFYTKQHVDDYRVFERLTAEKQLKIDELALEFYERPGRGYSKRDDVFLNKEELRKFNVLPSELQKIVRENYKGIAPVQNYCKGFIYNVVSSALILYAMANGKFFAAVLMSDAFVLKTVLLGPEWDADYVLRGGWDAIFYFFYCSFRCTFVAVQAMGVYILFFHK